MALHQSSLLVKDGIIHYEGIPLKAGDHVKISGIVWKVLGGGRSSSRAQTPYLWVRHDRYGTSLFAPSLVETPHQSHRPMDVAISVKSERSNDWQETLGMLRDIPIVNLGRLRVTAA